MFDLDTVSTKEEDQYLDKSVYEQIQNEVETMYKKVTVNQVSQTLVGKKRKMQFDDKNVKNKK